VGESAWQQVLPDVSALLHLAVALVLSIQTANTRQRAKYHTYTKKTGLQLFSNVSFDKWGGAL